jgi:hypothetical protein
MPYQVEDITGIVLSFLTIDNRYTLVEAWNIGPELIKQYTNPVAFVSRVFCYSQSLLTAIANKGCILAGLYSLEFYIPGSIGKDSN